MCGHSRHFLRLLATDLEPRFTLELATLDSLGHVGSFTADQFIRHLGLELLESVFNLGLQARAALNYSLVSSRDSSSAKGRRWGLPLAEISQS